MQRLFATIALSMLFAAPALADGKIYVQLPNLSGITGTEAEAFLHALVLANVVSSNCAGYEVSDEEWSLLTDSADILAREQLRLSVADYDSRFYGPAFAALDRADTCAVEGGNVQPVLARLIELGGSREALPDQDAAYQADQERHALWDALTEQPRKTKIK